MYAVKPGIRQATHSLIAFGLLFTTMGNARAQEKVIATVNGDAINQSEFYTTLEHLRGQDFLLPTQPPSLRGETAGFIVMNLLINQHLILQMAAKNNLMPTDAELATDMESIRKQDAIKKALADKLLTEDQLITDVRVTSARFKLATTGVTATDAEVEEWYMKHKGNYTLAERWGLSAILTSKMEDIPKIQNAIKTLSFAAAAREYSEDTRTRAQGGNLGIIFANNSTLPDSIRSAVRKLNVGEVSQPVQVDFDQGGTKIKVWWLLRLDQRDAEVTRPLTEVKPEVRKLALLEKAGGFKGVDDKMAVFRQMANIKINIPGYDSLLNPAPKPK